jgi:hypothetical protein
MTVIITRCQLALSSPPAKTIIAFLVSGLSPLRVWHACHRCLRDITLHERCNAFRALELDNCEAALHGFKNVRKKYVAALTALPRIDDCTSGAAFIRADFPRSFCSHQLPKVGF